VVYCPICGEEDNVRSTPNGYSCSNCVLLFDYSGDVPSEDRWWE